jgi:hypothetical protein
MTPDAPDTGDVARKAAPLVMLLHGITGVVLGVLFGWWLWTRLQLRSLAWYGDNGLDSWGAFALVVLGPALLFGVLGACLKERFWESWRWPFWW